MRAPAAPRAGVTEMKGVQGLLYGGVKTADGDLYGNFFEKQARRIRRACPTAYAGGGVLQGVVRQPSWLRGKLQEYTGTLGRFME